MSSVRFPISSEQSVSIHFHLERADQIPEYCKRLAETLAQAPLFDGTGLFKNKCKAISLTDQNDRRICDIFSTNSTKILGNLRAWHIHDFGRGNDQLYDAKNQCIKPGLQLLLYDQVESASLEDLGHSYTQVFNKMTTGWVKANIEDHPDIMFQQNPQTFELFIKERALVQEETLIDLIASKFSLHKDLSCEGYWLTHPGYDKNQKIYLWIRKTSLENIVKKIGFKFQSDQRL